MITFTHLQLAWLLTWFSCLWILVAIGACWVTRAIALDHAAAAEFATEERRAAGRHRLVPDDSGRPLAKPDTVPLGRLRVNFATGPVVVEQPPLRELARVGRTTDQIAMMVADTDRFIAAMRSERLGTPEFTCLPCLEVDGREMLVMPNPAAEREAREAR